MFNAQFILSSFFCVFFVIITCLNLLWWCAAVQVLVVFLHSFHDCSGYSDSWEGNYEMYNYDRYEIICLFHYDRYDIIYVYFTMIGMKLSMFISLR